MSKVRNSCGRPQAQKKRQKKQIEGQLEFKFVDNIAMIDDKFEKKRAEEKRQAIVAYYDAFLYMLEKYGKYNQVYPLFRAIADGDHSAEKEALFQNRYRGEIEILEMSAKRALKLVNKATESLCEKAIRIDIFDTYGQFDKNFCDSNRRAKYRKIIRRELAKLEQGQNVEPYSMADIEAEIQVNAARHNRKARQE